MYDILKMPLRYVSRSLRYIIRSEINSSWAHRDQDIQAGLQRKALEETIDYVERNMPGVDSVTSSNELLSKGLSLVKGDGLICEFGVFSGRSINHIASHVNTEVYGFDSFEGLPERWRDGYGQGFFKVDRLPKVSKNVVLIKGWFDKTLPDFVKSQSKAVAFLHIDCDLYSSTKTIFDNLGEKIKPGCVIVFDEYFNYPGWKEGEIKAFHEFLETHHLKYEYIGYNAKHEQAAVVIKAPA
ncbi:Macrocin-O-methyltransferase (TylF) [Paraburkholderia tuberum]|uniref:Macrocin-O-methyltransferase (TylF) n=2 Tax=Paraburkholderia tuberum TaxID=157910 RepID=A0A1H1JK28_9BURK|nr:Macrocin-O-methyltransferase (TylF) [Paraburkholderia tuberum]